MIVHGSWWSNGSARSTIIDYHEPFDRGFMAFTTKWNSDVCQLLILLYRVTNSDSLYSICQFFLQI